MPAASRLHGPDSDAEARFSNGEFISATTSESAGEIVPAGVGTVRKGGTGKAGACGAGRDANASECEQAQVDDLWRDEEKGGRTGG